MASITGATTIVTLVIPGIFTAPQQLQGFAADDVFTTDAIDSVEVLMGVDRRLSGGWVAVPVMQHFALQADSPSNFVFDTWWGVMQQVGDTFQAQGITILKPIGQKWAMVNGFLTSYKPTPDAKKLLQPRRFRITWESVIPAAA